MSLSSVLSVALVLSVTLSSLIQANSTIEMNSTSQETTESVNKTNADIISQLNETLNLTTGQTGDSNTIESTGMDSINTSITDTESQSKETDNKNTITTDRTSDSYDEEVSDNWDVLSNNWFIGFAISYIVMFFTLIGVYFWVFQKSGRKFGAKHYESVLSVGKTIQ